MVKGVDYSHYQNQPSVPAMAGDGIEFVIIKAWEGSSPDPQFKTNLENAQEAGMPVMAYVWLHASDDAARMTHCFDLIGDTVLCLDWEQEGVPSSVVEAWMDAYEGRYHRQGMVYYGLYPPSEATERIGEWPRWFPEYASQSKLPAWDGISAPDWRNCYAIWQNSSTGHVSGCEGEIDLDQLAPALTIDDLKKWLENGKMPRPHLDVVKPAIQVLQLALNAEGYSAGTVDGIWGPHTQDAINRYSGKVF